MQKKVCKTSAAFHIAISCIRSNNKVLFFNSCTINIVWVLKIVQGNLNSRLKYLFFQILLQYSLFLAIILTKSVWFYADLKNTAVVNYLVQRYTKEHLEKRFFREFKSSLYKLSIISWSIRMPWSA